MKFKFQYIILLVLAVAAASCKKDTKEAPKSTFKGRLVYNGQPINVEQNQVPIELYQSGFGKRGAIIGNATQDGSFSFLLFDGDYKLIIPGSQGPFRWNQTGATRDSLNVKISGSQTMDLEVTPYYLINDVKYSVNGRAVTAAFTVNKILTDVNARDIERVTLYINKTQFVSGNGDEQIVNNGIAGSEVANTVNLTATVPNITPSQNYVFARVGLKIAGVDDLIFSPLQKITL